MLAVTSSTTQTISLSIDGGSGRRDAYYVMYNIVNQPPIRSNVSDNAQHVSHVLEGLTPGMAYEIEVYAQSGQLRVNSNFVPAYTGTAAVICKLPTFCIQ